MVTVPDFIETAARLHGQSPALRFASQEWSYRELQARVRSAARRLELVHHAGRIGVLCANRPGVAVLAHACAQLQAPFVPLSWRLTVDELGWQVRAGRISTLVYDEARQEMAHRLAAAHGLEIIPLADLEQAPGESSDRVAPPIDLDREAAVLFTSGTTGRPKGARITYGNLWYSAVASALVLGHQPGDVWLAVLSLHHIGGLSILYRAAIGGATVALHERFEPEAVLAAIREGATFVSLVPTMAQRMLDAAGDVGPWPGTLRGILLGGAATPPHLVDRCLAAGLPILPTYGLTETASQAATLRTSDLPGHAGSSGQSLPLTDIQIVANGTPASPGEPGEIEVRGPSVFAGYLGEPLRDPGSWFATGDAGYLDDEGFLYVIDRRSDLIVSGGENVYPAEIERTLLEHHHVQDAAVVGIRHDLWGARPHAAVVWTGAAGEAETTLRSYCGQLLAPFKVPDRVVEVSAIPRSPGGKLLRREVRERMLGP